MSLTSLGVWECITNQDPARKILDHIKSLKPTKITLELIAKGCSECVRIAAKLNIDIKDLLIAENYRYINSFLEGDRRLDRVDQRIKNYDYGRNHNMALLRQAANRIENNPAFYYPMSSVSFKRYKEDVISEFYWLKKIVNEKLYS